MIFVGVQECKINPLAEASLIISPAYNFGLPTQPFLCSPRVTILSASSVKTLVTVKHSKAGLQTSNHPQNSASHLLGSQGPQQTPTPLKCYILLSSFIICQNICFFIATTASFTLGQALGIIQRTTDVKKYFQLQSFFSL